MLVDKRGLDGRSTVEVLQHNRTILHLFEILPPVEVVEELEHVIFERLDELLDHFTC